MMLKNIAALGALLSLVLSFAMPLAASEAGPVVTEESSAADDQPFDEATHAANVAKYGQSYMSTFTDLKEALKDDESKILERLSDAELLELAFAIETISRKTLDERLASKVKSAEDSVPSLFNGMMVFSLALLLLVLFCVLRIKTQSAKLAELEDRLKEMS